MFWFMVKAAWFSGWESAGQWKPPGIPSSCLLVVAGSLGAKAMAKWSKAKDPKLLCRGFVVLIVVSVVSNQTSSFWGMFQQPPCLY